MRISDWSSDVCSSDLAVATSSDRSGHQLTMNLPVILIIAGAILAFVLLAILVGGPSASKAKTRRLAMVKDRHAASTEAVVAAQMRKTIQSGRAGEIGRASWRERGCQYV